MLTGPGATIGKARKLRREMSLPEVLLWRELRQRPGGFKFRRQHPAGPFVLDFACLQSKLAIEIDGGAHDSGRSQAHDEARDEWLANQGYRTLRVPASEVLDHLEGVIGLVTSRCGAEQPLHHASPNGCSAAAARSRGSPGASLTCSPPPRAGEDLR